MRNSEPTVESRILDAAAACVLAYGVERMTLTEIARRAQQTLDDFQAKRAPDDRYVTAKLRALWNTKKIHKGGFYHDGRFAALTDVINHYDNHFQTSLTEQEKADLIEYLKSI